MIYAGSLEYLWCLVEALINNERTVMDSFVEKVIFTICGVLIAFCVAGIVVSIVETQRLADEMEKDECKQISSVSTGKRIYCGKACWRDEMKVEYTCNSGIKIVYK